MALKKIGEESYTLETDSELVQTLVKAYRWYGPQFSPRDVPRFLDVGSVTETPAAMRGIRDYFVARYRALPEPVTHIVGFDARGFLFGPMIAVELNIPFVLMRKAEKNAGMLIKSEPYSKEYKEVAPEVMTIRADSIPKGSRVVLFDDVLATGGTALSGIQLVEAIGAEVVEFACVCSMPFLGGVERIHATGEGRYKNVRFVSLVTDDLFTEANCADTKDYSGPRVVSCSEVLKQQKA